MQSPSSISRPIPGQRRDYRLFRPVQTRWADNDLYGHMNNVVHYQLFDTAVNGWLIETGLLTLKSSDTVFLVVETGCRYFAELAFPQTIEAGLRITHCGTSSIRYEIGLFAEGADKAAAEGHFVHVHVGRDSRRPVPLSIKQRGVLEVLVPEGSNPPL